MEGSLELANEILTYLLDSLQTDRMRRPTHWRVLQKLPQDSPLQTLQTPFTANRLVGSNLELLQGIPRLYAVFFVSGYRNEGGPRRSDVKGLCTKLAENHMMVD